eukprot:10300113-Alexandrium_andersonii.AAC.1
MRRDLAMPGASREEQHALPPGRCSPQWDTRAVHQTRSRLRAQKQGRARRPKASNWGAVLRPSW